MSKKMRGERRRHTRYDFPALIDYGFHLNASHEVYKGVTINISHSGLCLYVHKLLSEGQEISIKGPLPVPCPKASVRWIRKIDEDLYKTGLMRS